MRVRVKKGDCEPAIAGIIVTIVFLSFAAFTFLSFLSANSFMEFFEQFGVGIVFALVFFCFGILFLFYMIKPCKKYKGKLTYKKFEDYKGKNILVMKFKVLGNDVSVYQEYSCYTTKENDLVLGRHYEIFVKEFNWKIKRVGNEIKEEITEDAESNIEINSTNATDIGFNTVLAAVVMIFSSFIFISIYGLFKYPEYWFAYVGVILFFVVPGIIYYNEYRKHK